MNIQNMKTNDEILINYLREENAKLIRENRELKAELDKARKGNINSIMDVVLDNERLQAENDKLKYDLKYSYKDNEELKAENKRLNRVNAELSDKLQAVNDDYNNDTKVHNDYADGLLVEIKELKAELETSKQLAKDLSVGGGMPMNDNI